MTTVTVRRRGNPAGVILPARTRIRLGLEVGRDLTLVELADGIKLVRRNLVLERQMLQERAAREYGGIQGVKSEDPLHGALGRPVNRPLRSRRSVRPRTCRQSPLRRRQQVDSLERPLAVFEGNGTETS